MRLLDLDPQWVIRDGNRIGFIFTSPTKPEYRQSCFLVPPTITEQYGLFGVIGVDLTKVQPCGFGKRWQIEGGIGEASFETLTVTPSIDGSLGGHGLWSGSITGGELV